MPKYNIQSDDPMEMIWAVREKMYDETKEMNHEEFSAYIRKGSECARQEIAKRRATCLSHPKRNETQSE